MRRLCQSGVPARSHLPSVVRRPTLLLPHQESALLASLWSTPRARFTKSEPEPKDILTLHASTQPRFHASEHAGSRAGHAAFSSPVPKNGNKICAGLNASSNRPSSRLASLQPACQHRPTSLRHGSKPDRVEHDIITTRIEFVVMPSLKLNIATLPLLTATSCGRYARPHEQLP